MRGKGTVLVQPWKLVFAIWYYIYIYQQHQWYVRRYDCTFFFFVEMQNIEW